MATIAFSPNVGPIKFDCVITEDHTSNLEITDNPIETGSDIHDHAYMKPKEVKIDIADQNATLVFNALVLFQASRIPFYMITGLTLYKNMLIKSIDAHRDKMTSEILRAVIVLQEVVIVSTGVTSIDSASNPSKPGGAKSSGAATPSKETATDSVTGDRAAGTVSRGDTPTETATNTSILKRLF